MSKSINHTSTEKPSEKSFGVVFSIVFLIIAIYPLIKDEDVRLWAIIVSGIFLLLAFILPKTLIILNMIWFKFGVLLGFTVAPIVILIVYSTTVIPTGFIMRLIGKDLLKQQLDKNVKSYWIKRTEPMGTMKNQF